MINIGIIGYGYWGTNLVRNFYGAKDCRIKAVADGRLERLEVLARNFPTIKCVTEVDDLINDPAIDAVVIATPVFSHFPLAKKALMQGKHVLLEKPMTASVEEARILINLAEQKGLILMVDHTFLYTGAVEKMKELIDRDELGNLKYVDSTRINLGLFQADVNVLWDLAPHDISILSYLIREKPFSVNATGITHTANDIENIAYLTVNYQSGFIAHFSCSWTSPVKVRMMLIGGDMKMIMYNDLEVTEKVKIYDTGYHHKTDEEKKKVLVDYRTGDIYVPKLKTTEALSGMAGDFIASIQEQRKPRSTADLGLSVISILEASNESIKNNGREIIIKESGNINRKIRNTKLAQY
jgi:predicted dehydrogenase